MVVEKKTSIATVMLADMSTIYSLHTFALGTDKVDMKQGEMRLKDSYVQGLAEAAAKQRRGKVQRIWFDRGAGGYFADIEIPDLEAGLRDSLETHQSK